MPTYEYECEKCAKHIEVFLSVNDPQPETCEHCGGALQKVFFPVGVVFKGSGFYATDSRKNGATNGAASKPAEKTEEKSTTEKPKAEAAAGKSDTKASDSK